MAARKTLRAVTAEEKARPTTILEAAEQQGNGELYWQAQAFVW